MTLKSGKGGKKYLNLSLHYLELSVIDYLLNSSDEVLFLFFVVLTMVAQLTPLKEKSNISQK